MLQKLLILLCLLATTARAEAALLRYGWQEVAGVKLFFREGGPPDAPTLVFLHGNPSSSIMYEKVMEQLVANGGLHVIAMDYPAFGYSDAPDRTTYRYTFDHLADTVAAFLVARGIRRYGLYMQDYGVPVGFRLITAAPGAVSFVVVQNGVIHLDGFPAAQDEEGELRRHWRERNAALDARRAAARSALRYPNADDFAAEPGANPDASLLMAAAAQRPGVSAARDDLWFDYGSNLERYASWQAALKELAPPLLVIWGSRDDFFTTPGAFAYLREVPQAEIHVIDSVHFATLDQPGLVAELLVSFLRRHALGATPMAPASH